MSSSDGAAASAAADGAAPARPGLGARLATLAERFRLPATRLSLVILLTVFALVRASPDSTAHLALVPAHTVPRVWNVVTSSWVEPTPPGVAVAAAALVALGRAVEPGMGARETARFLLFVSAFVGACAFALSLARFHLLGGDEKALYDAHCGFQGIVAGLLVVCKRDAPDAPVNARGLRWMRREQLCGVHLLLTAALGLATGRVLSTFGFAAFGLYGAWVYLRHIQLRPEGAGHGVGDPSDRMDLVTFLPRRAAPLLAPALDARAHEALCGRRQRRLAAAYGVGSLHAGLVAKHADTKPGVTTDDAAEAQRRRERGAKALAERLALKAKREKTPAPSFRGDPDPLADATSATSASDAATRAEGDVAEAV